MKLAKTTKSVLFAMILLVNNIVNLTYEYLYLITFLTYCQVLLFCKCWRLIIYQARLDLINLPSNLTKIVKLKKQHFDRKNFLSYQLTTTRTVYLHRLIALTCYLTNFKVTSIKPFTLKKKLSITSC